MNDFAGVWRQKSDEDVAIALTELGTFNSIAQRVILVEAERRGMPVATELKQLQQVAGISERTGLPSDLVEEALRTAAGDGQSLSQILEESSQARARSKEGAALVGATSGLRLAFARALRNAALLLAACWLLSMLSATPLPISSLLWGAPLAFCLCLAWELLRRTAERFFH